MMTSDSHCNVSDKDDPLKAERKRQREKQRRNYLTSAFEDLGDCLNDIEGEHLADQHDESSTRVDLLRRAISALDRFHLENGEMKHLIENKKETSQQVVSMEDRIVLVTKGNVGRPPGSTSVAVARIISQCCFHRLRSVSLMSTKPIRL